MLPGMRPKKTFQFNKQSIIIIVDGNCPLAVDVSMQVTISAIERASHRVVDNVIVAANMLLRPRTALDPASFLSLIRNLLCRNRQSLYAHRYACRNRFTLPIPHSPE